MGTGGEQASFLPSVELRFHSLSSFHLKSLALRLIVVFLSARDACYYLSNSHRATTSLLHLASISLLPNPKHLSKKTRSNLHQPKPPTIAVKYARTCAWVLGARGFILFFSAPFLPKRER